MYFLETFCYDFEQYQIVPVYPWGTLTHEYVGILGKTNSFDDDNEEQQKAKRGFTEFRNSIPKSLHFVDIGRVEELNSRVSFNKMKDPISQMNQETTSIKFLESYVISNEEDIDHALLELKSEENPHSKYVMKPDISQGCIESHTFQLIQQNPSQTASFKE